MKRSIFFGAFVAGFALLPACGVILNLPDPSVDPNFGSGDGSLTGDGGLADGALPDGFVPPGDGSATGDGAPENDGSVPFDAGPLCGSKRCFGGVCGAGDICEPIAVYTQNSSDPTVIDADDRYVYFASGVNKLVRLDPTNGATLDLATAESDLADLKVVGANVYFTSGGLSGGASVASCSINGCTGTGGSRVNFVAGSSANFFGIAVDATNVYFASDTGGGGIQKCALAGGASCTPIQISASSDAHALFEQAGVLFWDDNSGSNNGVYQCNAGSCAKSGADDIGVVDIASNATTVYWTTQSSVEKHAIGASGKIPVVTGHTNNVAVAADAIHVYWLDKVGGTNGILQRCPVAVDCTSTPSAIETLANNLKGAADLVITADSVYFTTADDGKVWRVAK